MNTVCVKLTRFWKTLKTNILLRVSRVYSDYYVTESMV